MFDVAARPWVTPDNADAATLAAVVERCPSGALQYNRHDDVKETPPDPTIVTTVDGGRSSCTASSH